MKKNYSGIMYFYVHFVVELLCFYYLSLVLGDNWILWLVPFVYDILAFVPQILFGAISDYCERIPFGVIGIVMMMLGLALFQIGGVSVIITTIIIALGNACVHVNGAEVTLRSSKGKMSPAAVFVAGGSFGLITGKIMAGIAPAWVVLLLLATAIPLIILAEKYRARADKSKNPCKEFEYANTNLPIWLITITATLVVAIRGFVGYSIPTSWNTTVLQAVLLFGFMGVGKALGGLLIDRIGIRKTIYISMLGAIPFLLFGNELMWVSLIGVMFFSMTMAITLAILVSTYQKNPGVAFGFTTVGLALGSMPVFFFRVTDLLTNGIIIVIASIVCLCLLLRITKKEKKCLKS